MWWVGVDKCKSDVSDWPKREPVKIGHINSL